jgi:hypothetical protein
MPVKKKENPGVSISMSDLVLLHYRCTVVFQENLFGWTLDRQIDKIGTLAKQAVEYKIGEELTAIKKRREEIEEATREPYKDKDYDEANDREYQATLRKNKEYVDLYKKEKSLWEVTIPDFQFQPVKVKITDETIQKIKKPERSVFFRAGEYKVEVFSALRDLIEEGYLIETN